MDFASNEDQLDLQAGVREFCSGQFPLSSVRALADTGGWSADLWDELHGLGVFELRVPESEGGIGLGLAEAALVFEELGRALVPGPLVATHLAVTHLGASQARTTEAIDSGSELLLVAHREHLDALVSVDAFGVHQIDLETLGAQRLDRPLDPLTPWSVVTDLRVGSPLGGADIAETWQREASILTAAQQVGIAAQVLETTVRHALTREQFGRPIGAQQAVKHRLADMLVRVTVARSAVLAAAVTADDPVVGDPARAASAAKVLADDAAVQNSRAAVQLHGGMGFAWETGVHLFLKRAWVNAQRWGTADEHAERLAVGL
jgi:alkylation response protein AidB-like acyl-CoA dehydrogenase